MVLLCCESDTQSGEGRELLIIQKSICTQVLL